MIIGALVVAGKGFLNVVFWTDFVIYGKARKLCSEDNYVFGVSTRGFASLITRVTPITLITLSGTLRPLARPKWLFLHSLQRRTEVSTV
jgi:hypothetical protein